MDGKKLREIQAPIKKSYIDDPETALITLSANGTIGEGVTCSVQTSTSLIKAGLHPATGGSKINICSGDMLLEALVACSGVTLNAVATALNLPIGNAEIHAEGEIDFRGTLGVSKNIPVGFKEIRLVFKFENELDKEQTKKILNLTERYCVVLQTIKGGTNIEVSAE